jgi:hypothetical protein
LIRVSTMISAPALRVFFSLDAVERAAEGFLDVIFLFLS